MWKVRESKSSIKAIKKSHYILIKGTIEQKDIIIISAYASNIGAPNS
jgi:hypothetical protein